MAQKNWLMKDQSNITVSKISDASNMGKTMLQITDALSARNMLGFQPGANDMALFISPLINFRTLDSITIVGATTGNRGLFVPDTVGVICNLATAVIGVAAISFGTNAAVNDLLSASVLTGLTTANLFLPINVGLAAAVQPNTALKVRVTGISIATAHTGYAFIKGFYTGL